MGLFSAEIQAQDYVKVLYEGAELHHKPDDGSEERIPVLQGDIFEITDYDTEWVAVSLFSGETRYLKHTSLEFMYNQYAEIDLPVIDPEMCVKIEETRKNSEEKAYSTWPDHLDKRIQKEKYLFDKNVMKIFREAGISAIYPSALMQCANDSIAPQIIEF
ncbi:hypothetical protein [Rhodohalobacter sp. SW132]|nr:hypothetical protein [Rhodohalobacter sp. SW132]